VLSSTANEMDQDLSLPSYSNPPLDEVAADMQFATLPLKAVDVGAFHALIEADYPNSLDVPPLPPTFETVGPGFAPPFAINMRTDLLPRSWFVSSDDEHVVQFQADRLIVNWRMRPAGGAYPRYPEVRRRFVAAYEALVRFVHRRGYPDIVPNQCDLTYFNKVPLPEGVTWGEIHQLLRGMELRTGPEWTEGFEDYQMALGRSLPLQPQGALRRLLVECRPVQTGPTQKAWALNVIVRGRPGADNLNGVLKFFDMAHIEIVNCFTAITTETMHTEWGRQR